MTENQTPKTSKLADVYNAAYRYQHEAPRYTRAELLGIVAAHFGIEAIDRRAVDAYEEWASHNAEAAEPGHAAEVYEDHFKPGVRFTELDLIGLNNWLAGRTLI